MTRSIRYRLTVHPHGSLFVGGYAQARGGSDGDTAGDPTGALIPGSAVKGALREAAVRLVRGAGRGEDLLRRLFGDEHEPVEGALRVGSLRPRPVSGSAGRVPEAHLRHHVSLERATRQAAPGRLFQNRVTPAGHGLSFEGEISLRLLEDGEQEEEMMGLLRAAVSITDQLGGGRGRGLGWVTLELTEVNAEGSEEGEEERFPLPPLGEGEIGTCVLLLEALEPVRFGGVKDGTNYLTSRDFLAAEAVRGAVAAALADIASTEELEDLLGGASAAVFGDGRAGGPKAIPAPMTLREPKAGGDDLRDYAGELCAEGLGLSSFLIPRDTRVVKGTVARSDEGWRKINLKRRTVTRTARDHASGRAADRLLHSLEILDPVHKKDAPLRFHIPVRGTARQLSLTRQAAVRGLLLGGTRSRGCGRFRLASLETDGFPSPLAERHRRWVEHLEGNLGITAAESTGALLALGPLVVDQPRLLDILKHHGLELVHGVARRQVEGGWNSRMRLPRNLASRIQPGSVLLVRRRDGASALSALNALEEGGIGPGRADGWGRLVACHPIHIDCWKEA